MPSPAGELARTEGSPPRVVFDEQSNVLSGGVRKMRLRLDGELDDDDVGIPRKDNWMTMRC